MPKSLSKVESVCSSKITCGYSWLCCSFELTTLLTLLRALITKFGSFSILMWKLYSLLIFYATMGLSDPLWRRYSKLQRLNHGVTQDFPQLDQKQAGWQQGQL